MNVALRSAGDIEMTQPHVSSQGWLLMCEDTGKQGAMGTCGGALGTGGGLACSERAAPTPRLQEGWEGMQSALGRRITRRKGMEAWASKVPETTGSQHGRRRGQRPGVGRPGLGVPARAFASRG